MNSTDSLAPTKRTWTRRIGRAAWAAAALLVTTLVIAAGSPARAGFIATFTNEHVDVDLRFEGGKLAVGWHDETNDIEYEADEALVQIGPNAIRPRPASPAFNFLGVGPGDPVFILPQVQDPSLVFLGIGSEEIDDGVFMGDQVTLSLIAVRGPGFFSVWTTDAFGNPTVFMASADGISPLDRIVFPTGTHQDLNWGFTAAGFYEIDVQLSGVLVNGQTIQSEVTTLSFSVGNVVPEPASGALLVLGTVALVASLRRCRKGPAR